MSSKESKAALKAAKTAIQAKDYKAALEHCHIILEKDAENYNALVFAGLCFSETAKSEEARDKYRKAIKSQPQQILAYQGLANLYTKHWRKAKTKDDMEELVTVYEKLIDVVDRKDPKKRIELVCNFCNVLIERGDFTRALESLSTESKEFGNEDNEIKRPLFKNVFKVLDESKAKSRIGKYSTLVDESFANLLQSNSEDEGVEYLEHYLGFLRENQELLHQRVPTLLDVCLELSQKSKETLPLEIITQAFVQNCEHRSLNEIGEVMVRLQKAGNKFAEIGNGFMNFTSSKFDEAYVKLDSAISFFPSFLPGWITLCKSALNLHKHGDAKILTKRGLTEYKLILSGSKPTWLLPIMSLGSAKYELSKCLAMALCGSHIPADVTNGIGTFQKLLEIKPEDVDLHIGLARGFIKLEKYPEASEFIDEVLKRDPNSTDAITWKAFIECKIGSLTDGFSMLESISPPTSLSMFLLGKCMWKAGGQYRKDKKNCFTALVKAAKKDPFLGETFLLLGHFYAKVQRDNARAKGCYQKSYQLDPHHQETVACLADTYVAEGDVSSAVELYKSITSKLGSAGGKWAWLRLGLYQLKAKDMTNAIQCFQSALRIDSEDSICWECLGEGYLQRGSFTAAWKAFVRSHQLNPQSTYSLYQMAKVKQVQGLYPEAITEFSDVLELFPDYVPALQGLAESQLLLARQMFHEGRFQTGLERLENAIKNLTSACCLRKDLCCLWKLLGDCCMMVYSFEDGVVNINVPSILLGKQNDKAEVTDMTEVGKSQLLILGPRFYRRALLLESENPSLWHDLGVSYFRLMENCADALEYTTKAMNAVKKAITLEPKNHTFWCSLGVIAASKFVLDSALAQHCFLKSIESENNNVEAWSNLAILYLTHDQVKLAHEAFKVAQSLEPSFTNSWVGQAIIAETIGSEETMNLYRHSTELGLQKQGASGYASCVVKVMAQLDSQGSSVFKDNIRDMNAVSTAVTQMSKMSAKNPKCAWISSAHGFLLEQSGLNRSAEKAYRLAYEAMKTAPKDDDSEAEVSERTKICSGNLARALCKIGNFDEAVALYADDSENANISDMCGLALACYKSGQFEKALEAYKSAGQVTTSEDRKAQIMVAMAMVYWKMKKPDEAKTMLYQCFQSCKPGLNALLSLGIAMGDKTLVAAAMGEVVKKVGTSMDEKKVYDDCILISAAAKSLGDEKLALNIVQKALYRNPTSWSIRVLLCRLLAHPQGFGSVFSAPFISMEAETLFKRQSSSNPLPRDSELWKSHSRHQENVEVAKCCALAAVSAGADRTHIGICGKLKARLQQAQRFAHMHPYEPSSWSLLSCACHARNVATWFEEHKGKEGETTLTTALANRASRVAKFMEYEEMAKDWIQEIKHWDSLLSSRDCSTSDLAGPDVKLILLLKAATRTKDKPTLQTIFKEITTTMGSTSKPAHSSLYFAELLDHMKMHQVSRKMLEKSVSLVTSKTVGKLSMLFRLFQFLYDIAMKDEVKRKEVQDPIKNVVAEFVNIDPKSTESLLFQGLAARLDKNHRKAKSYFNRVINSTDIVDDETKSVAIWYLYRTLHERDDATEIEKLIDRARSIGDRHVARIVELLPLS